MQNSLFLQLDFFLLLVFSFVVPVGIYIYMLRKNSISRKSVVVFAVLLIVIAGLDVLLLQTLRQAAQGSTSLFDDKIFRSELSIALYVVPAIFLGIGINLLSHILVSHLENAEKRFDRKLP